MIPGPREGEEYKDEGTREGVITENSRGKAVYRRQLHLGKAE